MIGGGGKKKMDWSILFFINSILLGAGLAMDAFSVSVANGLSEPKMRSGKMCAIAGVFGIFQAVMPMIGWVCVNTVVNYFKAFEKFIPWIALILLLYIGGKMLCGGLKNKNDESEGVRVGIAALIVQGIATSIDALSVGFAIAEYDLLHAVVCALTVAVVTFLISLGGVIIGKKFGATFNNKAEAFGGIILIIIGLEIFITGII